MSDIYPMLKVKKKGYSGEPREKKRYESTTFRTSILY